MARTASAPRLALLAGKRRRTFARVYVEDPDSVYQSVTSLQGFNFLLGGSLVDNLDQAAGSGSISLIREHRADGVLYSLAPTMAASPINRNGADDYAKFLKAGRGIKVYLGWDAPGAAANFPGDFLEVFRGKIDKVNWKGKTNLVTLEVRDLNAWLLDKQIEVERVYGDSDGVPMETVMQQILDDNEEPRLGAVVLNVPVSPGVNLHAFTQARKSTLEALRDLAFQIGWDVRFKWQADDTYKLTLFEPARAKVVPDWTVGPDGYFDVAQLEEGDADVRNKITGKATDVDGLPLVYTAEDAGPGSSQSEYGVKYMEFVEDSTSTIDTMGELEAMVDAALSDLKAPRADQEIDQPLYPIAEVGDLGRWLANGKHYDADQDLGVVQVRHEFSRTTRRTHIQCRGTVAGGSQEWLRRGNSSPQATITVEQPPALEGFDQLPGADELHAIVGLDVTDGRNLGGVLEAWINGGTSDNADPTGDPDGTVTLVATPAHVDDSTVWDTPGGDANLLDAIRVHPGQGKRIYFRFTNTEGVDTGQLPVIMLSEGGPVDDNGDLVDGIINSADNFATTVQPVRVAASLPTGVADGTVVLLTTDGQLYRRVSGAWTLAVPAVNITGTVVAAQIADAAITTAKFASGLRPVRIVTSLPGSGDLEGDTVYLTTDDKLYRWTGSAWIATVPTTDLTGTIATAQIAANAVTTAKIAADAITAAEIAAGAVGSSELAALAVTTAAIAANAITTAKIAADAVTAAEIASGAVGTTEIAALAVTTAKIAAAAVTAAEIGAAAVGTAALANNAVTSAIIAANAVTATQIATDAVTTPKLIAGAITTAKIAAGAVTATEIAANTITAGNIAAATITATEIAASTITGGKIAATTITASNIVSGTITGTQIAANTITAAKITAATITTAEIASGTITAGNIASATITSTQIAAGTITASNILSATITGTQIAATTIAAANIVSATITTAQIASGTITAGNIASGTITATQIAAGTITASNIASATITATQIASGTITATQIASDTITAGQIAAGAISTSELAANAVTAAKIASATITSNEIAANTITAGNIASATITATQIAAATITSTELASNSIIAGKIAAGAINAASIIVDGTITAAKLNVSSLSAITADIGTITAGLISGAAVVAGEVASDLFTATNAYFKQALHLNYAGTGAAAYLSFGGVVDDQGYSAGGDPIFNGAATVFQNHDFDDTDLSGPGGFTANLHGVHVFTAAIPGSGSLSAYLFNEGFMVAKVVASGAGPSGAAPEGTIWCQV